MSLKIIELQQMDSYIKCTCISNGSVILVVALVQSELLVDNDLSLLHPIPTKCTHLLQQRQEDALTLFSCISVQVSQNVTYKQSLTILPWKA